MPSTVYIKYRNLFRDEEQYNAAYDQFKDEFLENYSLSACLGQENTDYLLDTLVDDPAKARQQLKDHIAAAIPLRWEEYLYEMQEDSYLTP